MISLRRACSSQVLGGAKRAAVCSMPPSEVGIGMIDSCLMGSGWIEVGVDADGDGVVNADVLDLGRGRK